MCNLTKIQKPISIFCLDFRFQFSILLYLPLKCPTIPLSIFRYNTIALVPFLRSTPIKIKIRLFMRFSGFTVYSYFCLLRKILIFSVRCRFLILRTALIFWPSEPAFTVVFAVFLFAPSICYLLINSPLMRLLRYCLSICQFCRYMRPICLSMRL